MAIANKPNDGMPIFEPMTGALGAEIKGIDLREEQSQEAVGALNKAFHEHGVLVVHAQDADDEDQKRFARYFGPLYRESITPNRLDPEVVIIDSLLAPPAAYRTNWWHVDSIYEATPPKAGLLRCVVNPRVGGDTLFASSTAAYEGLSDKMQKLLDGVEAVHTTRVIATKLPKGQNIFNEEVTATHPLVITDPVTRRKSLYIDPDRTTELVGFGEFESERLIKMLCDHITNTPDFHVRVRWRVNTMVIWNQFLTMHRATADYTDRRVMHRVTICSDRRPSAH